MQQAIYLRHRRRILLPEPQGSAAPAHAATLLKNIEALGFTDSAALLERMRQASTAQLGQLYTDVLPALRELVGAHVAFKPMYPGFPEQVMSASDAQLYINALIHYLTHQTPPPKPMLRRPLIERSHLNMIDLGNEDDFRMICTRLLGAKSAISAADKQDVRWFFQRYGDGALALVPEQVPLRENAALLGACILRHTTQAERELPRHIKSATDVLRLAVALADGDLSLAQPTRFPSYRRAERRTLLALLERAPRRMEDMLRYPEPWKRLGERLHPGELQKQFPQSYEAFAVIRNDLPAPTFRGQVERAIADGELGQALGLLATRPGELARRLDHLLRIAPEPVAALDRFATVAAQVSTPVLLQLLAHLMHRSEMRPLRTFFPKGDAAKAWARSNTLPPLDEGLRARAEQICRAALIERFRALPPLGRVFVDERLRDYTVPFTQRSASKALRTIPRGSRLPLPDGETVRFFLWWKEGMVNGQPTGRVDIDLSAVLYDHGWGYLEHISYTNLRSQKYRAAHSGDIVTAPNGACEFIDIDIASALRYGGRYVVMSVNAFTDQPFCNLPECFGGWMMRSDPGSGEPFEPTTVQDKLDLSADTRICIPVIIDLHERRVVWADLALRRDPSWNNNIEGNAKGTLIMGQAMTTLAKPDLHTLFSLHAEARGTPALREQADVVFAPDGTVTPFDIGLILAEYL
ncbi:TerD family protein [Chloroflexia bacterium SDU3-3]|nr:TerD family protein [Chloroflexia bacterium SDU3-3]